MVSLASSIPRPRGVVVLSTLVLAATLVALPGCAKRAAAPDEGGLVGPQMMQDQMQQHMMAMEQDLMGPVSLSPPAYLCCGDAAMLPVRAFANWLGADLTSEGKRLTLTYEGHSFACAPGQMTAEADGQSVKLPKAPRVLDGSTYVALRPLVEALGGAVTEFDAAARTARVTFGEKAGKFRLEKRSPCPVQDPPPPEDDTPDWWHLDGKPSQAAIEHRASGCTMIGIRCSYVGECGG